MPMESAWQVSFLLYSQSFAIHSTFVFLSAVRLRLAELVLVGESVKLAQQVFSFLPPPLTAIFDIQHNPVQL